MTVKDYHKKALEYNDLAIILGEHKLKDRPNYNLSFEYEKKAYLLFSQHSNSEPTKSILLKSVASLALMAGRYDDANTFITLAISLNPDKSFLEELNKMKDELKMQFEIEKKENKTKFKFLNFKHILKSISDTGEEYKIENSIIIKDNIRDHINEVYKNSEKSFSKLMELLYNDKRDLNKKGEKLIDEKFISYIKKYSKLIDSKIIYERDYDFDYFSFKFLEDFYLLKVNQEVKERPQHMFMRVALCLHHEDLNSAFETYDYMSELWFVHSSQTLLNAGKEKAQLASGFLLNIAEDSISGIFEALGKCSKLSLTGSRIGISINNIRAQGSFIKRTGGTSNGIIPMLKVFNDTSRYVDQRGFTIYLEPWHADIFEFLEMKKNHGKEQLRARDLFYGLWVPDLFMQRVKENGIWSLFSPEDVPGLNDTYGSEFEALYKMYEIEGKVRKTIIAQELWFAILDAQIETGLPYILYKDTCNQKSNQKNLGTIKTGNFSSEIIEYTADDEVAVCNEASISLPKFVEVKTRKFDFKKLHSVTKVVTRNLNKIIDINYYPIKEAENSNFRHRPISIGVQGLADVYLLMGLPYDSEEAKKLNCDIFETIYHGAVEESCALSEKDGIYESFYGSPSSKGILQFDMWGITPSDKYDWDSLKAKILDKGLRNSLLLASMPTESTSQILGTSECFEPYKSYIYYRRTNSGEYTLVNKYLLNDLTRVNLWDDQMKQKLIASNGSVQNIPEIPDRLKALYKTAYEISQKAIIEQAADRGAFICQSQSLNLFVEKPLYSKLTMMHFYTWQKGLKTGMYFLIIKEAADSIKSTMEDDPTRMQVIKGEEISSEPKNLGLRIINIPGLIKEFHM